MKQDGNIRDGEKPEDTLVHAYSGVTSNWRCVQFLCAILGIVSILDVNFDILLRAENLLFYH